jgi:hypothetical protein
MKQILFLDPGALLVAAKRLQPTTNSNWQVIETKKK